MLNQLLVETKRWICVDVVLGGMRATLVSLQKLLVKLKRTSERTKAWEELCNVLHRMLNTVAILGSYRFVMTPNGPFCGGYRAKPVLITARSMLEISMATTTADTFLKKFVKFLI